MIKRSSGYFRLLLIFFIIVSIVFISLSTGTGLTERLGFEACFGLIIITILSLTVAAENILYKIGIVCNQIEFSKERVSTQFEPLDNINSPFISVTDEGIEKYVFFVGEGKILSMKKENANIQYDQQDNVINENITKVVCNGIYKKLYGDGINIINYDIYTTINANSN